MKIDNFVKDCINFRLSKMLSRVNTEQVVEKIIDLGQELDLLKCTNIMTATFQTTIFILEASEDNLGVSDLAEYLVRLWFPSIVKQKRQIWNSQWTDINLKVVGIILNLDILMTTFGQRATPKTVDYHTFEIKK